MIVLPFPVSVNALYNGGSAQKRFPSKRYKAWLKEVPELEPLELTECKLEYRFYFPDNRNRDSENYTKCVSDYLVKSRVIIDDNWHVVREMKLVPVEIDRKNPRVEVIFY